MSINIEIAKNLDVTSWNIAFADDAFEPCKSAIKVKSVIETIHFVDRACLPKIEDTHTLKELDISSIASFLMDNNDNNSNGETNVGWNDSKIVPIGAGIFTKQVGTCLVVAMRAFSRGSATYLGLSHVDSPENSSITKKSLEEIICKDGVDKVEVFICGGLKGRLIEKEEVDVSEEAYKSILAIIKEISQKVMEKKIEIVHDLFNFLAYFQAINAGIKQAGFDKQGNPYIIADVPSRYKK